jgi:predicted RNase H-like nuclease (RuvC/YqgF family)
MKTCRCCGETKSFDSFYKSSPTVYASYCKECNKEKVKQRRAADPEKYKAAVKTYETANKEKTIERAKAWYKNNTEKVADYRQANKEKIKEVQTAYRKAHPEKWRVCKAARRAAELQRLPAWLTEFDHLKIKCLYQVAAMRSKESGEDWHVDHIIPLRGKAVSGLHVPSNLQVIPATENRQKNNAYVIS